MIPESEENRLDQSLRSKFEGFDLTPGAPVWAGIEQRLPPPPVLRRRRRPGLVPLLFVLTAFLAGLGGWLLPHAGPPPLASRPASVLSPATSDTSPAASDTSPAASDTSLTTSDTSLAASRPSLTASQPSLTASRPSPATSRPSPAASRPNVRGAVAASLGLGMPTPGGGAPVATFERADSVRRPLAMETVPATLRPLVALERQTLVQLPSIATLAPGNLPADSRTALLTNLRTERAELFRLQRRTDSLLLALGDLPGAPLAAPAVAAAPATDTAKARPLAHRWSLLLTATPEQNTLTLQGPENDPLTALRRNHETGRAGVNAAIMAEYKVAPRLSVGGGVGYSTYGADLRITNKTTDIFVRYDTTTTHTNTAYTATSQTHSIRIIQVPQLSPVFNGSGQVIRYDTVYVPRQDTVFTTIVQHDTVRTTRKTITPSITKKETLTTKLLQPNYRFFTVPVLLRYRLTMGPGRWWADVSAGAQLQFFLGGTQVVTDDGETFRTETIRAGSGPFRPLNVAFSGSLALNYALTHRLSVSVAPSMRWQALSMYKTETGLIQQPTATGLMFGVRLGL